MSTRKLSEDRALEILNLHRDRIWRCGTVPYLHYKEQYPDQAVHSLRSRASIVNDLMVLQAHREFDGVAGVRFIEVPHPHTRTLVLISGQILLRLKMLDEGGRPSNLKTKFIKDYENDLELPGIPPRPHRMTLGYVLDPMQTAVSRVLVTSHTGSRLDYFIQFYIPEGRVISIADAQEMSGQSLEIPSRVMVRVIGQRSIGE